jgi:hypothetical protein
MRTPNTTFDVYLDGRTPDAGDPDLAGVSGHLRDRFARGSEVTEGDRTFFWTAILEVPLGVSLPDAYPGGPSNTTLWFPDQDGDPYTLVFVERERRMPGGDFQRAYLVKGLTVAITVKEADDNPTLSNITTLIFDQADGFSVSQPAANRAKVNFSGSGAARDFNFFRQIGTTHDRRYLAGALLGNAHTTAAFATDALYAVPFWASRGCTLDRIGFNVVTPGVSGDVGRCGIYESTSETDLYPAALVLDGGEQDLSLSGMLETTISQALAAGGLYWFVFLASAAVTITALQGGSQFPLLGYDNALTGTSAGIGWSVAQSYGSLPDPFPTGGSVHSMSVGPLPAIACRLSA